MGVEEEEEEEESFRDSGERGKPGTSLFFVEIERGPSCKLSCWKSH